MLKDFDVLNKDLKLLKFFPTRTSGIYIFDKIGNKKIDLSSNLIFGYNNKLTEKSIIKTLNSTILNHSNIILNQNVDILKAHLYDIAGFNCRGEKKIDCNNNVEFCNSSTETIETAIKIARKRYNILCERKYNEIICFKDCDYGNSITTISASNKQDTNIEPLMNCFKFAKFDNIKSVDKLITEHTSAVLLQTIQFKNGINKPSIYFLQQLRKLCTKHEILLILDETKCGCGKTGTFFEYEKYNILPDIVCISNDFAGGFDFGACIISNEITKYIDKNCNKVNNLYINISQEYLNILSSYNFLQKVEEFEEKISISFDDLLSYDKIINKIDVYGLFCIIQLQSNINNEQFAKILFSNDLIVECIDDNCLKLNFPIICTNQEIKQIIDIIKISMEEIFIIERY